MLVFLREASAGVRIPLRFLPMPFSRPRGSEDHEVKTLQAQANMQSMCLAKQPPHLSQAVKCLPAPCTELQTVSKETKSLNYNLTQKERKKERDFKGITKSLSSCSGRIGWKPGFFSSVGVTNTMCCQLVFVCVEYPPPNWLTKDSPPRYFN